MYSMINLPHFNIIRIYFLNLIDYFVINDDSTIKINEIFHKNELFLNEILV